MANAPERLSRPGRGRVTPGRGRADQDRARPGQWRAGAVEHLRGAGRPGRGRRRANRGAGARIRPAVQTGGDTDDGPRSSGTNDGPLAHRLAHPRYGVEKVYEAEVEGRPAPSALRRLEVGVELDDGHTAPARARLLAPSTIELVLHEGRKHQVKRMCEAVGHPVRRLHRSRYAGLTLEGLEPGAWRELEPSEVNRLRGS